MVAATNASNSSTRVQPLPTPLGIDVLGMSEQSIPQLLGWAINSYAPLMLVLGVLAGARSYMYQFLALLEKYFTTELHVRPADPPYDMLMAWVYANGLNKSARSRIVRVDDRGTNTQSHGDGEEKPIWFAPWNGSFVFWFRGTPLSYQSYTTSTAFRDEEHIIIKCLGRTAIFEHSGGYWKRTAIDVPRPLSTVIITEELKKQLVDDLEQYLDAENQAKYSGHRMPYRRGYLLYGPPGTGKSSLTAAIAGHCGLNIYIVDIPSVNDEQLRELFRKLPRKCIVLLEDIDAVGADRDEDGAEDKGKRHRLSLSGLLNALDGVAAQQGRLLLMTTNHREKLDPALIRPGRIDLHLELNYADSKLTTSLFEFMYKPVGDAASLSKAETVEIERAAREFATVIPEHEFSVAEIMSYIQQNWESPAIAVKNSKKWVTQALKEKEDRRREDISRATAGSVPSTTCEAVEEGDLEWLWMRRDAQVQNDITRTKNRRNLPAAACNTPPPSPCEKNHHPVASQACSPYMGSGSPRLPVQSIGSFGWPFSSTFPDSWLSDGMDDCRTEASDASSEGLFIVPPKRLPTNVPRTASYESCPGLVSPSQTSLAQTDSFDSPAAADRVCSSWYDEEIRRRVQEWRHWSDSMTTSVGDIFPVEDADNKFQGHGANNGS